MLFVIVTRAIGANVGFDPLHFFPYYLLLRRAVWAQSTIGQFTVSRFYGESGRNKSEEENTTTTTTK